VTARSSERDRQRAGYQFYESLASRPWQPIPGCRQVVEGRRMLRISADIEMWPSIDNQLSAPDLRPVRPAG
jgi:hypothetical protein